ncbi:MAG: YesL family protein [Erysipelotrichaceae bacterium]|nr:YesL family protein [Erysipelotrichaceae bacterium]
MNRLAGRLTNIVLLGFFTTLLSLPLVSAGAAFTALNKQTKAYIYEGEEKPLKPFINDFKRYFKTSTKIWLLALAGIIILVLDYIYYITGESTLDILASAVIFVLIVYLLFISNMVFVIIPEYENAKLSFLMKKALDISLVSPLQSVFIIFITAAVIVVSFVLLRGMIIIVPGVIAYLSWQFIPEMIRKEHFRKT